MHLGLPSESSSTHTVSDTVYGETLPSGSYLRHRMQADMGLPYSDGTSYVDLESFLALAILLRSLPAVEILCPLLCPLLSGPGPSSRVGQGLHSLASSPSRLCPL